MISFFVNRTGYDITWKCIVQWDKPRMTIWRICIACWINNLKTHTHIIYLYLSKTPAVARTPLNVPSQYIRERASSFRHSTLQKATQRSVTVHNRTQLNIPSLYITERPSTFRHSTLQNEPRSSVAVHYITPLNVPSQYITERLSTFCNST